MRFGLALQLFAILLLAGCAPSYVSGVNTRVASFVDNAAAVNKPYKRILVRFNSESFSIAQTGERAFKELFNSREVVVSGALEVFPPTREYNVDDVIRIITQGSYDLVAVFDLSPVQFSETYIPPSFLTQRIGGVIVTSQYGGYNIQLPAVYSRISLYDAKTGKVVLVGQTSSSALNGLSTSLDNLMYSLVYHVRNDLVTKNLVPWMRR